MGIPAPAGVGAAGTPPANDQANFVIQGTFAAVGPGDPFAVYGAGNGALHSETNTALTTVAGSNAASVASAAGLAKGQSINSTLVPPGTTIKTIVGANITLAFAPSQSAASVLAGTDNGALFSGAVWGGSVQLERSFDGGQTWIICGIGGNGTGAIYTGAGQNGTPVSIVFNEPEKGVLYRWNCTALTSGTVSYRISGSGIAAMTWGVPII